MSPILDKYKIFAKVLHRLIKFEEEHDGEATEHVHSRDRPNLCAKMMPRSPKNDPRSIFTTDVNLTTSKTPIASFHPNQMISIKW